MERQKPRVGGASRRVHTPSRRAYVWLACALVVAVVLVRPATAGERSATDAPSPSSEAVALAVYGMAALGAGHYGEALEVFAGAAAAHPTDPTLCTGAGLAATMLGRQDVAMAWLEHALRLDDGQVEATRVLGELYYRVGRGSDAIALYERALDRRASMPLAERAEIWRREVALHAGFSETRGAHFSVLYDRSTGDAIAHEALAHLEGAYRHVGAFLDAYPSAPITVVLYTPDQFRDVARLPAWAGGAFDGRIRVPVERGGMPPSRFEALLTHEFVHAVVAALSGPSAPAWLNEGLAGVMEPGGAAGARSVLAATAERIPLADLHQRFAQLPPDRVPLAYAQSAHAVQRLIDLRGPAAATALLRALGDGEPFGRAFARHAGMSLEDFDSLGAR
jgi:tetratricopeptide (TPR) repeat protein